MRADVEEEAFFFHGVEDAAEARAGFEQKDGEAVLLQAMGAGQAGDAAAYDNDGGFVFGLGEVGTAG